MAAIARAYLSGSAISVSGNAAMKGISASTIVLSGALILTGGSFIPHGDTQAFFQLVGAVVGLIGLVVWFRTLGQSQE